MRGLRAQRLLRWTPSPFAQASLAFHGAGAVALAAAPQAWPQVLGALALNHAVLTCGMHPRSALLGGNLRRLPRDQAGRVAITFDDGPDPEVTPQLLDILDAFGAKASFFVIGRRVAAQPALAREMVRRGHDLQNHSHRHPVSFACWGPVAQWRELHRAQEVIAEVTGQAPRFFRAPMGIHSPLLEPGLAAEGLGIVSWTRRGLDTLRQEPGRILARLTRGLASGDILLLHDGSSARGPNGRPLVLEVLPELLRRIAAAGLSASSLACLPRANDA